MTSNMKKCYQQAGNIAAILGMLMLGMLTNPAQADAPEGYHFLTYDAGIKQALALNKKLFLYFGRLGCGFCAMVNKQSFSNSDIKNRYSEHYVLVYVDSESGDRMTLPNGERITGMQLGEKLNVLGTPVFLFLEPDGTPIIKRMGVLSAKDFVELDDFIFTGIYKKYAHEKLISQ